VRQIQHRRHYSHNNSNTYSATAAACGISKTAHMPISNTRNWYQQHVQSKQVYKRELQAVKALQRRVK